MVLEDVESDNEGPQKHQVPPKPAESLVPPPQAANTRQEVKEQTRPRSQEQQQQQRNGDASRSGASESGTKMSQEDAETQTGRWTPFIQSIKKEAEDGALATIEER